MTPTIGRIVHYTLNGADVSMISGSASHSRNPVSAGQVYPAMIVRTWGDTPDSAVNLQVFLDGDGSYWATSRQCGEGEGHWAWPPRAA